MDLECAAGHVPLCCVTQTLYFWPHLRPETLQPLPVVLQLSRPPIWSSMEAVHKALLCQVCHATNAWFSKQSKVAWTWSGGQLAARFGGQK